MESSRSAMAILKVDHQIFYLKPGFHLIGSDKNLDIYLKSKAIDEKHALLEISSHGMKIIDLQSKNGTYIYGNKIDCVKLIELPKKCSIQLGNITGNLKLLKENDSGFLEKVNSKDTSEIIVSSPEQNPETHTFYLHSKQKKKITSTPNNSTTTKTEFLSLSSKDDNENLIKNNRYSNKKNVSNSNCNDSFNGDNVNNKSSFFVPETQAGTSARSQRQNSNCNDSIKEDQHNNKSSFFVPETQQIVVTPKKPTSIDIFSDKDILKNVENLSDNDEFSIPETQDIYKDNNKIENSNNSQITSLFKITTQEFNATAVGSTNLDASSDLSNDSQNLCNGIQLSSIIPLNKPTTEKSTNIKRNNFITDDEDDYDVEMSALKWNENYPPAVSNSTTPDFLLDKNNILQNNNKLEQVREDSITPDFLVEVNHTINNSRSNSVTPDLIFDGQLNDFIKKDEDKSENNVPGSSKKNECNVEQTQIFIKPKPDNINKSVEISDDFLEPTQLFVKPMSLSNHSDKENTTDAYISNNKDRKLSTSNQHIDNFDLLEPTQPFIREKINNVPENNSFHKFTLDSDDDEMPLQKSNLNINRNKLMSSSDDDEENLVKCDNFKTPILCIKKFDSNCSSNGTISHNKKKYSISSTTSTNTSFKKHYNISNDNNSQNNFEFLTSTPQLEFIKPHDSNDIKQAGNLFNNTKSKNKKILLEESSDDDSQDIDNLLNRLDDKNYKKRNKVAEKSKNMEKESKSTRPEHMAIRQEKRTSRQNVKDFDSTDSQIRKSTRIKTLPSYIIQSYIVDNFTEALDIDQDYKTKEKPSRKRSHNIKLGDDEYIPKVTKASQNSESRKKTLLSRANDECEEREQKKMIRTENVPSRSENSRVLRRHNKTPKHKFVFTIVDPSKYRDVIESMGSEIIDNPKEATILITTRIIRTWKFMVALARGIPIVSHKWLDSIISLSDMRTTYNAFLIDDPQNEKKFEFSLERTLKLSSKNLIFKNHTFLITPKTTPPPDELIQIIACTGGQYVKEIPKSSIDISRFYVVSDKKDKNFWPKIKKSMPNVKIISTEGILLSVMQHTLRLNDHLLGKSY